MHRVAVFLYVSSYGSSTIFSKLLASGGTQGVVPVRVRIRAEAVSSPANVSFCVILSYPQQETLKEPSRLCVVLSSFEKTTDAGASHDQVARFVIIRSRPRCATASTAWLSRARGSPCQIFAERLRTNISISVSSQIAHAIGAHLVACACDG